MRRVFRMGPRGGDSPAPHAVGLPFGRKAESRGELREKCGSHPGASASGLELRALETAVGGRRAPESSGTHSLVLGNPLHP